MQVRKFVSYLRVSTQRQGQSGLGLEAQRDMVAKYVAADRGGELICEYVEVESGKKSNRPQLNAALAHCRKTGACLIIAKLDRLARNAGFLLSVVEGCAKDGVVFCDFPDVPPGPVGKLFITLLAAVAEFEAGMISQRTKAALAVVKVKGTKSGVPLGATARDRHAEFAARHAQWQEVHGPELVAMRRSMMTIRQMVPALTARGIPTPGGGSWRPSTVHQALERITTGQ